MNICAFRSLLFTVVISVTLGSRVLDLTDDNFKDSIAGKDIILVEFFAPWCGHCKKLAPEYEKAAAALHENDPPLPLAKIDCVGDGKETCSKYEVSGYPSLKIFRDGEMSQEYDGPRHSAGIIEYMKKKAGPASIELRDVEDLKKKLDEAEQIVVVGYFGVDSALKESFLKAADKMRDDYSFLHTTDVRIMDANGYKDVIVLHRQKHMEAKFEESTVVSSDAALDVDGIVKFIEKNEAGLVGQLKPGKEGVLKRPLVVAYYKVDWKKNLKGTRYWRNRVARVAKKFVDKVTFGVAAKEDYERKVTEWGGVVDDDGIHVMAFDDDRNSYKMKETFSVDNLEAFVNDFSLGKLKPYVKSEPIPESNEGAVKVVVGDSFNDIVKDPTKDVLIELYAPWCGHCKNLEPTYLELAERLKDVKDVVIAKMDATANDPAPQYEPNGFPTFYWAPMGSKDKPKKYEGKNELKDFIDFIKKEATNPVDIPEIEIKEKRKKKKKKEEKKSEEL